MKKNTRSVTKIKECLIRDFSLCRCCGFKGSEVHHIIPLIYGGRDELDNMLVLCSECHRLAPDNPKDFEKFMNFGGATIPSLYGRILRDLEDKKVEPQFLFPKMKEQLKSILYMDTKWALEDCKKIMKDCLLIKDINISKLKKEFILKDNKEIDIID